MREERKIIIDGQVHTVLISDEQEALLAAHAAGRAIVGFWDRKSGGESVDLSPAQYVVESPEDVDDEYLEQVVRRTIGLPWIIGTTERLAIREFTMDDISTVPREEGDAPEDEIFYTPEKLKEYIRCQYGFYQYGIWALIRKSDGRLVGKAGVASYTPEDGVPGVELGYHIFSPYRNQGYAVEACKEILAYAAVHLDSPVYARIDASNEASIRVAASCGFQFSKKVCNESGQYSCLYVWSC